MLQYQLLRFSLYHHYLFSPPFRLGSTLSTHSNCIPIPRLGLEYDMPMLLLLLEPFSLPSSIHQPSPWSLLLISHAIRFCLCISCFETSLFDFTFRAYDISHFFHIFAWNCLLYEKWEPFEEPHPSNPPQSFTRLFHPSHLSVFIAATFFSLL